MINQPAIAPSYRSAETGNVLFYIFICIILLGALTMYISSSGGDEQATGSAAFRMAEDIKSQAQGTRAAIMECLLIYNSAYPAQPGSGLIADAQCETATATYQNIFTAQSARAVPIPPNPFAAWTYTNSGSTFVKITTTSNKPANPMVRMTLRNLAQSYRAPETNPGSNIYQNQDVCIIDTGTKAEFHACLKSSSGVCGKAAPNNQTVGQDPCEI